MSPALTMKRLFDWKVRGIRWIEIIGVVLVAAMVFSVYVAKAAAARESARIGELEREISSNYQRVRLLRAEVTRLEQPGRLEALSRQVGLAPVDAARQTTVAELPALKPAPEPAPAPLTVVAPVVAPDAAAELGPEPEAAEPAPVVEAAR